MVSTLISAVHTEKNKSHGAGTVAFQFCLKTI